MNMNINIKINRFIASKLSFFLFFFNNRFHRLRIKEFDVGLFFASKFMRSSQFVTLLLESF